MSFGRSYSWTDDARLIVWPANHPYPSFRGDLASCVRRAIGLMAVEPMPDRVEIAHDTGPIQLDEIRRMAAEPTLPAAKQSGATTWSPARWAEEAAIWDIPSRREKALIGRSLKK